MAGFEVHGVSSPCVDDHGREGAGVPSSRQGRCKSDSPVAGKVTTDEWFTFETMTDADLSALGEARHKTIGGRGIVGRLIDGARK